MTAYVARFDDLGLHDVALVGGKSAHLADLLGAGFPGLIGFSWHGFGLVFCFGGRVRRDLAFHGKVRL